MSLSPDLAPDIEERILAALLQMFSQSLPLVANQSSDRLALKVLHPYPLQDDPTLSAPYLIYGPDYELGTRLMTHAESEEYGCAEIGGPVRFLRFYSGVCGTPIVTTREQCYTDIATLSTRVMQILMQHFDLSNILGSGGLTSPDQSTWIEGANPRLIDGLKSRIKGGEQTWFGEATLTWHYPVSWWPSYFQNQG